MADPFWDYRRSSITSHSTYCIGARYALADQDILGRSSSYTSSVVFEKDMSKLMNATPWKKDDYPSSPPRPNLVEGKPPKERLPVPQIAKVKSQPKVAPAKGTRCYD
jgi:serine/threonine-protein kinase GIN4